MSAGKLFLFSTILLLCSLFSVPTLAQADPPPSLTSTPSIAVAPAPAPVPPTSPAAMSGLIVPPPDADMDIILDTTVDTTSRGTTRTSSEDASPLSSTEPRPSSGATPAGEDSTGEPMTYAILETVSSALQAGTSYTLDQYISAAFDWFLTLIAIIAILLLIVYGIGYTAAGVSEAGKMSMKNHLTGVMYGVGIALGGWILLTFVNPQITGSSLKSVDDLRALMPRATATPAGSTGGGGGGRAPVGTGLSGINGGVYTNDGAYIAQPASSLIGIELVGESTTFGGAGDTFGQSEIHAGDTIGLGNVRNRSQIPAGWLIGSTGTAFGDLDPNQYYFAAPSTGGVDPTILWTITDNTTGHAVNAYWLDNGPRRTGTVIDLSQGSLSGLGATNGGVRNSFTITRAPAGASPGVVH